MTFRDLQFNISKLKSNVKSQVARSNPLQNPNTLALNLWLFEERNDMGYMRNMAHHHTETNKAFLEWLQEEMEKNKPYENFVEDIGGVGAALYKLFDRQTELETEYEEKYKQYRRALKAMRTKEIEWIATRDRKQMLQDRIDHISKSNAFLKKVPELQKELDQLNISNPLPTDEEVHDYKRFILREAFYTKFNAMQELAEKMAILAGYGKYIVDLLDDQNHASSNADMILADALLSMDTWKPKDERATFVEEDDLFQQEEEEESDALYLTDKILQAQRESIKNFQQPPSKIEDIISFIQSDDLAPYHYNNQGQDELFVEQSTGESSTSSFEENAESSASTLPNIEDAHPNKNALEKDLSPDDSSDKTDSSGSKKSPSNSKFSNHDYYYRLYREKSRCNKKPIQRHRTYAEFQSQFDLPPDHEHLQQQSYNDQPPPSYSSSVGN